MKNKNNDKYFYCYDFQLYQTLQNSGFFYIFSGKTKENKAISIWEKTSELEKLIHTFSEEKRKNKVS